MLPGGAAPETRLLLVARGVRAVGDGFVSLLLPVYLLELGHGPLETGIIATATLAGSALLTLLVGLYAHRASGRSLLIGAALLMTLTGIAFATVEDFWPLLLVAFVGTLNPSSGDVSVFLPLEQAQLARLVSDRDRTRLFARYSFIGSIMAAVGALGAALPEAAVALSGAELKPALQTAFLVYAALGGLALLLYRSLPPGVDPADPDRAPPKPLGRSRRIVLTLAALFSLDAFAGGLVVQSLLALWLFERLRPLAGGRRRHLLLDRRALVAVLLRRRLDRRPDRPHQYHGVHAPAGESLPRARPLRREPSACDHAVARAQRALPDGRADPDLVRHGSRRAGGADSGRQRNLGTAQPRGGCEPNACRRAACGLRFWMALVPRRRTEDHLRSAPLDDVPKRAAS
jgi:hypothetical protein